MSATGLQHAIDQHTHLKLNIDLYAPYIIIPYGGKYMDDEHVLVVNLGNVRIHTLDRSMSAMDIKKLHAQGIEDKEILKAVIGQSYDQFRLELTNLQIILAQSNENWKSLIHNQSDDDATTNMYLLHPVSLNVSFSKCLITDDPRLPLTKITGELPSVDINVSDARLLLLIDLITSIPLPASDVPELQPLRVINNNINNSF